MATIPGTDGPDTLPGTEEADTILGGDGADSLVGGLGDDGIEGGPGDDRIIGGDPAGDALPPDPAFLPPDGNLIQGGEGNDTAYGGYGADQVFGGEGDDVLTGSAFYNSTLISGPPPVAAVDAGDLLDGGPGADLLNGGPGADTLRGGEGNDTLAGGTGPDVLTGGPGADSFDLRAVFVRFHLGQQEPAVPGSGLGIGPGPGGRDLITDFAQGEDSIGLGQFISADRDVGGPNGAVFLGTRPFQPLDTQPSFGGVPAVQIRYEIQGDQTLVQIFAPGRGDSGSPVDGELLLGGAHALTAADFGNFGGVTDRSVEDWNALAAQVQANFAATGRWFIPPPQPPSPFVEFVDWNALAAQVQANFAATGQWSVPTAPPPQLPFSEPVDWNALAAQAQANFAATGRWFITAPAAPAGPLFLFTATDPVHGTEPWVTNGTPEGTQLLRDLNPGPAAGVVPGFFPFGEARFSGGRVLFSGNDGAAGFDPWTTDGTAAGTRLLRELWPGPGGSGGGTGGVALGAGRILFAGREPVTGSEPWITDGTSEGTRLLRDINPGALSGAGGFVPLGDGLAIFPGTAPATGSEPWITDGTPEGTRPLGDINPGFGSSGFDFRPVPLGDGRFVLAFDDGMTGNEPWVTDLTPEGTRPLGDLNPGAFGSDAFGLGGGAVALGNGLVLFGASDFGAGTASIGLEPWVTDGTPDGTRPLGDLSPGIFGSAISFPGQFEFLPLGGGTALFQAGDPEHGDELWITDGTPEGTRLLVDINPGPIGSGPTYGFLPLGDGRILFGANGGTATGFELWITDGTASGTQLVHDINPGSPGSAGPDNDRSLGLTALGDGRALFTADDGTHGREVWVTDGTAAGTRLVRDINPGAGGVLRAFENPLPFAVLGDGRAVFVADDGSHGREPWVTDGTEAGTRPLADIMPGTAGSNASLPVPVGPEAPSPFG